MIHPFLRLSLRLGYWRQSIVRKARAAAARKGHETRRKQITQSNPFAPGESA